jgi:hypothetical protein
MNQKTVSDGGSKKQSAGAAPVRYAGGWPREVEGRGGNGEGMGACEWQGWRCRRGRLWRSGGSCDEPLHLSLDAGEECGAFSFFSLAADGVAFLVKCTELEG